MKRRILFVFCCALCGSSYAQNTGTSLTITNADHSTTSLAASDIKNLPHKMLQVTAHDGKQHTYTGVALSVLLQKAGVPMGDSVKKKTVSSYVLITAADNYRVVYALAEVDSVLSDKKIILADADNGQPLPANALPYQIITTNEKIHARMIRQVVSTEVRRAL